MIADALIDKFLGDAMMALFNAPIPQARHQEASLLAAKALLEEAERLNLPFAIGVGINTGNAVTGNRSDRVRQRISRAGLCAGSSPRSLL